VGRDRRGDDGILSESAGLARRGAEARECTIVGAEWLGRIIWKLTNICRRMHLGRQAIGFQDGRAADGLRAC
jgi:hypothetical protein